MKYLSPVPILVTLLFFLLTSSGYAQDEYHWHGKWSIETINLSFCNIHISPDKDNPSAVIEGANSQGKFLVRCKVKEVPSRKSIIFYEEVINGKTQYSPGRPLLILLTQKQEIKSIVWGEINLNQKDNAREHSINKIAAPSYKGNYTVWHNNKKANLKVKKKNNTGFYAVLKTETASLDCKCDLESSHLAACYPNNQEVAPFYLIFHKKGVRLRDNIELQPKKKVSSQPDEKIIAAERFRL